MIKENVRKEICLLLIAAILISLSSGQTVSAAIRTDQPVLEYTAANMKLAADENSEPEHDSFTENTEPSDPVQPPDQMDISEAVPPVLNTDQLHLVAGGQSCQLQVSNAVTVSYAFSLEFPVIAVLSEETARSVTITPTAPGFTILTADAVGSDGNHTILTCQITVSDVSVEKESVNIYLNDEETQVDLAIHGMDLDAVYYGTGNEWEDLPVRDAMMDDPQCTIQTGNPGVAEASFRDGQIHIKGIAKGITNARLTIYGISLHIRIQVHHYTLNKYVINTYQGSAVKSLKLKGAQGHKVTWVSGNNRVASVSRTGIVTINGTGTTKITAKVNRRKVVCIVSVSSKTAYRVVKDARAITKKKNIQYSQAMRMSKNYYDCSSLIYRCFRPYGIRFGYTHPSWAPTAAEEGYWCKNSGHLVSTEPVEILSCKLVPGDTIYYSFNGDNGRYLDIDHTAIFSGYAYDPSVGYYGTIIEASSTGNTVAERAYYPSDYIRLIGRPSKK